MTKTTQWGPQAASIIALIRNQLGRAQLCREADQVNLAVSRARVEDLQAILHDAEKQVGPDKV